MTDIRSQILSEVEDNLGPGYVVTLNEILKASPTLSKLISDGVSIGEVRVDIVADGIEPIASLLTILNNNKESLPKEVVDSIEDLIKE